MAASMVHTSSLTLVVAEIDEIEAAALQLRSMPLSSSDGDRAVRAGKGLRRLWETTVRTLSSS
jgi:hypothetical protein